MNDDGSMARLPQLKKVAEKFDFKLISIKDLIEYRVKRDSLIEEIVSVDMPTKYGHFKLIAFQEKNSTNEHLALVKGSWEKDEPYWFACIHRALQATYLDHFVVIVANNCMRL
jgi:3,4-dihydroxy 2-butanone 4-phosphate synthase/GTP cyclohydrolase II